MNLKLNSLPRTPITQLPMQRTLACGSCGMIFDSLSCIVFSKDLFKNLIFPSFLPSFPSFPSSLTFLPSLLPSYLPPFFPVTTKIYPLRKFQVCYNILLTAIILLHIRSPKHIHLITETLYTLTNISSFPPLPSS